MKNCEYILFIVLNDIKKVKDIKKKFKELNILRYTVIDTIGSTAMEYCDMKFSSMMRGSMGNTDIKQYNKTIFVALPSEEEAVKVMDEIEAVMNLNVKKPGKGIMFTIPIYKSQGIRF